MWIPGHEFLKIVRVCALVSAWASPSRSGRKENKNKSDFVFAGGCRPWTYYFTWCSAPTKTCSYTAHIEWTLSAVVVHGYIHVDHSAGSQKSTTHIFSSPLVHMACECDYYNPSNTWQSVCSIPKIIKKKSCFTISPSPKKTFVFKIYTSRPTIWFIQRIR